MSDKHDHHLEEELNNFPKYKLSEEKESEIFEQLMITADELDNQEKRRMFMKRLTAGIMTVAAILFVSFFALSYTDLDLFNAGNSNETEEQPPEEVKQQVYFNELVEGDIYKLTAITNHAGKENIYRTDEEQIISLFTEQMESMILIESKSQGTDVHTSYELFDENDHVIASIDFISNKLVNINGERYEIEGNLEAFENTFFTDDYLLNEETVIVEKAEEIVQLIADQNFEELSKHVHEEKGLLFSPYIYIDEEALVFYPSEVRQLMDDQEVYVWGHYDGNGFPIELMGAEYYEEFIYNKDYVNAEEAVFNEYVTRGGMINNINDQFPNSRVVEYFIPGSEFEMDWGSLNLVFEQNIDGEWKLVAIVHDRWTV